MERFSTSSESLLSTIGKTDLLPIPPDRNEGGASVFAKLEGFNPGGSVKDRIALFMIEKAEREGRLKPGMTIVESTSGNTGIGLALVSNIKNYPLVLFMPDHYSLERRKLLEAYGAKLMLTPAAEDMDGARRAAMAYCESRSDTYMPRQFENPANPETHECSTALEILEDVKSAGIPISGLVLGVGTGGSLTGTARVLKRHFPQMKVVAIEPAASPVLSGGKRGLHAIHGIGAGFVPEILDRSLIDEVMKVREEEAFATAETLARTRGLLVGISSGANVFASREVAKHLPAQTAVVTFLCDQGQRYFSLEKLSLEEMRKRSRLNFR